MVAEHFNHQTCKNSFGVEKVWDSLLDHISSEEGRTKYCKKLTFLSNVALIEWSDHANRMRAHEGKSNQHNLLSAVMFYGQQCGLEIEQTLPF